MTQLSQTRRSVGLIGLLSFLLLIPAACARHRGPAPTSSYSSLREAIDIGDACLAGADYNRAIISYNDVLLAGSSPYVPEAL